MLGLAFKGRPETDDLRGTMAKPILEAMRELWPAAVYAAYDPLVEEREFAQFGVARCLSLPDAFDDAALVVIQNNHPVFAAMPIAEFADRMRSPGVIYDYWNLFENRKLDMPSGRTYCALGAMG
jgi:UDP-N-acetyl-D-mannosaminuronic acid dehydrogenase